MAHGTSNNFSSTNNHWLGPLTPQVEDAPFLPAFPMIPSTNPFPPIGAGQTSSSLNGRAQQMMGPQPSDNQNTMDVSLTIPSQYMIPGATIAITIQTQPSVTQIAPAFAQHSSSEPHTQMDLCEQENLMIEDFMELDEDLEM